MIARETVMQEQEIDAKRAVQLAKDFARSLYETEKISHLGLEAVERTEDGRHWLITLGFSRPWMIPKSRKQSPLNPLEELLHPPEEPQPIREYKVLRVDGQSGDVVGMQMFEE